MELERRWVLKSPDIWGHQRNGMGRGCSTGQLNKHALDFTVFSRLHMRNMVRKYSVFSRQYYKHDLLGVLQYLEV